MLSGCFIFFYFYPTAASVVESSHSQLRVKEIKVIIANNKHFKSNHEKIQIKSRNIKKFEIKLKAFCFRFSFRK